MAIKIETKNYTVTSEGTTLVLNEKKVNQKTGEVYLKVVAYHSSLESLMKNIRKRLICDSEITTWEHLMDVIKESDQLIKKLCKYAGI